MKLKKIFSYVYKIFKYNLDTQKFVFLFVLSIVLAIYGSLNGVNFSYLSSLLLTYNNPFYVMCLLLLLYGNTKNVYDICRKNYEYIIRFKCKKEYIKNLFFNVVFNNLILFVLNFILLLLFLNFFGTGGQTLLIKGYDISSFLYLLFCIFKFIVLVILVSMINICLLVIFNNKVIMLLNVVFCISLYAISLNYLDTINSIIEFPLYIGYYFLSYNVLYNNFGLEVICFNFYLFIMFFVAMFVFRISCNRVRDI